MKKTMLRWLLVLTAVFACLVMTAAATDTNQTEYTIILDVQGGNPLPAITTAYGAKVTAPGDPTRYGYDFGGWYADEALTTPYTFTTMPMGGTTVYAKWVSRDQDRGIEYRINDITFRDPDSYELLDEIPDDDFLAEVSVTNIASTKMDTVLFVSYSEEGQMLGFHYAFANPSVGQSMTFGTAIDNKDGQVGKVKAMVLSSLAGAVPLAEAVDTNEGIDLGALVNDIVLVSEEAIEEAVPVGVDTIRLDVTVIRTGEVKNIRVQEKDVVALGEEFYVCRYVPGERRHVLTVADNEVLADELDLKVVTGFITENQATGENYTMVGYVGLNIETGLDMLGHYVTAYYSEAYESEKEPGVAYFLVEKAAAYFDIAEDIDAQKEYLVAFGSKIELAPDVNIFSFDGAVGTPEFNYDADCYIASAGTYVIDKTGKICAYIAPVSYSVGQVSRVVTTAGKESIQIGTIRYDNTEEYDEIVEYEGIAEGDVVIIKNYNGITYLEKAEIITGKVTKTATKDGKNYTYIDDTPYVNAGQSVHHIESMIDPGYAFPNSEITYDAYIYNDKLLGLIEHTDAANLSDAIYVVGNYCVSVAGIYGSDTDFYYAQGINAIGEEVSVLIGVEGYGDGAWPVVTSLAPGFYTFEQSLDKEQAKKDIMVATAVKTLGEFDSEIDKFFAEDVTDTINANELKKDDKYILVDWGTRVFLTADTKFMLVDATTIGDELEIVTYTGPITKAVEGDEIAAVVTVDEYGNYQAEIMVIVTPSVELKAEDYIYVVDGNDYSAVKDGFEYNVFFTSTNEFKTIVSDWHVNSGFYGDYTVDEDGIYELGPATGGYDVCVCENQILVGVFGGSAISSQEIDLYDAANAVIVDVRGEDLIEDSEVGEIETLQDIVSAYKAKYQVHFNAIVDIDGDEDLVTHIFVTDIVAPDDITPENPETPDPDAADPNDAIYVVGNYCVSVAGTYGIDTYFYYAQGIDAAGKEVSILIGVDDLGVQTIMNGFYTFKKATTKEEAKEDIMVATAATKMDMFDDRIDTFFAEAVTGTINMGELKKDDKYVWVNGYARVFLSADTKFMLVDATTIGDELEIVTYTGPITKAVEGDEIAAVVTVDEYGNYQAETMVIVTPSVELKAEDYIYVVDGNDYSAVKDGFEYNVFFTSTNEFKPIVSDWHVNSGFYGDYTVDEDGIYDLGAPVDRYDDYVLEGQIFAGIFGSYISSDNIDLYDAANAVIVDVRSVDDIEDSEVAEIETLQDIVSAYKAEYQVHFSAIVDIDGSDDLVTHIFVTDIYVPVYDEYDEIIGWAPEFD